METKLRKAYMYGEIAKFWTWVSKWSKSIHDYAVKKAAMKRQTQYFLLKSLELDNMKLVNGKVEQVNKEA